MKFANEILRRKWLWEEYRKDLCAYAIGVRKSIPREPKYILISKGVAKMRKFINAEKES